MKLLLIVGSPGAAISAAIAEDPCAATDLTIKACVRQNLIDDTIRSVACSPTRAA